MTALRIFFVFSALMVSAISRADNPGALNIYTCTLRVFDASRDVVIEQTFQANESAGTHGGDAQVFSSKDASTKVAVAADGKWILLNWSKNDKTIANVVFVVGNASTEPRVAIVYNPENTEEQASVDCQPNFKL